MLKKKTFAICDILWEKLVIICDIKRLHQVKPGLSVMAYKPYNVFLSQQISEQYFQPSEQGILDRCITIAYSFLTLLRIASYMRVFFPSSHVSS
jgi:hypothetical protein